MAYEVCDGFDRDNLDIEDQIYLTGQGSILFKDRKYDIIMVKRMPKLP